jgi:hypothetical protein
MSERQGVIQVSINDWGLGGLPKRAKRGWPRARASAAVSNEQWAQGRQGAAQARRTELANWQR